MVNPGICSRPFISIVAGALIVSAPIHFRRFVTMNRFYQMWLIQIYSLARLLWRKELRRCELSRGNREEKIMGHFKIGIRSARLESILLFFFIIFFFLLISNQSDHKNRIGISRIISITIVSLYYKWGALAPAAGKELNRRMLPKCRRFKVRNKLRNIELEDILCFALVYSRNRIDWDSVWKKKKNWKEENEERKKERKKNKETGYGSLWWIHCTV